MRNLFLVVFLIISNVLVAQTLPPNYRPKTLSRETASIFIGNTLENNKLRISVNQTSRQQTATISLSGGDISVYNYRFDITFENIYDSYIFLSVSNGNHITQKGPSYPYFNACTYGSTARLYINTDQQTFVLGPGERKVFKAYTNQSDIANFYYPNVYNTYADNIARYSEYYEPLCVNFPFAKHYVPYEVLEDDDDDAYDVGDLLDELEDETDVPPPNDEEEEEDDDAGEVITGNTNVFEESDEFSGSSQAKNYDVNACERAIKETKEYYDKLYDILIQGFQGTYKPENVESTINSFESSIDFTNKAIAEERLSPECLQKLSKLEQEFDAKYMQKTEELAKGLHLKKPEENIKVHKYLSIPKFNTSTNSAEGFKKKGTPSKKDNSNFKKGNLKGPEEFNGTFNQKKN